MPGGARRPSEDQRQAVTATRPSDGSTGSVCRARKRRRAVSVRARTLGRSRACQGRRATMMP
jgi:hypothetical protein